jgi:orsellinic acid C2-O-methyltransferase
MPMTTSPPLHELALADIPAQIVYAAAELRIADLLADGPRTATQLADAAGAHAPSLRRLLLALAALGVVAHVDDDRFELTDAGRPLMTGAPDSVRELIRMLRGPEMARSWGALVEGLRTGACPWELAHGMPVFQYYGEHPEAAATFNAAMAEHTRDAAPGIVAAGDFSRFRSVVDVGGGDGTLIAAILAAHPQIDGVTFDAAEALDPAGPGRVLAGDFFSAVPEGADAYVLKQVLHDWADDPALAILRSCRLAMSPHSRLLIVERVVPERVGEGDVQPLLVDLVMLVATGGRERTEPEFRELLAAVGLALVSVTEPIAPFDYRVIEARRAA